MSSLHEANYKKQEREHDVASFLTANYIVQEQRLTCSFLQLGHGGQTSVVQDTPFPGLSGGTSEAATFALKSSETNICIHECI